MRKLFVLGDSISIQYGPYLAQMLRGAFGCSRKEPVVGCSPGLSYPADANGGDSSMVLTYLQEWLAAISPDFLLLNCGLHDLRTDPQVGTKQVPPDRYRANLGEIAQVIGCHRISAAWVRTTPVDDETHNSQSAGFHRFDRDVVRYNEIADAVFGEAGIPIIDLYTFTLNLGGALYCDHVHFTSRVRELQAAYIAGSLLAFV